MAHSKAEQTRKKQALRVWLRMLSATTRIEKRVRSFLKREFDSTLPRFDVLAELDRETVPITMSELTEHLLVTNGNVTGLVNRLVEDGLVARDADPVDRRVQRVILTDAGRAAFRAMAESHEKLIDSFFSSLSDQQMDMLLQLTTALNNGLRGNAEDED